MAKEALAGDERGVRPHVLGALPDWDAARELRVVRAKNPLPKGTLGDFGLAARVGGPPGFGPAYLVLPFERLVGIDPGSTRMFRWDARARTLRPVWDSGINLGLGFVWARIERPGTYVPLGLPRDHLLREVLFRIARERLLAGVDREERAVEITRELLSGFLDAPDEELQEVRRVLATIEVQTTLSPPMPGDVDIGAGGHVMGLALPGGASLERLKERIRQLEIPRSGLPEEVLFFPPERPLERDPPWPVPSLPDPVPAPWPDPESSLFPFPRPRPFPFPFPICLLFSKDWWMYHHDERHSGHASGCSDISRTNVGTMILRATVPVDGSVVTIPTIVAGKIYVGTYNVPGVGGTLYKIDLTTGTVEASFSVGTRFTSYAQGIGGSPAVVGGRVYISNIPGRVYCLDAATLTQIWMTDLRFADAAHNQPVNNPTGDCFSSPLVVDGKVYVGSGEGEYGAWGFVFCLDAQTGRVVWLFCTNQFTPGVDNAPNVIPASAVGISPLPAGFAQQPDPPHRGASVWSSCAFDRATNRIYVGTGNSVPDDPLPDEKYASGIISLDATTGAFGAFFQPDPADSYRQDPEGDLDVDVPAGPTVYRRGGQTVVAIGSKNGSFFLLDPVNLNPLARRQLLPKDAVTNATISTVDPHVGSRGENLWGVFATAAVHPGRGRLFAGLGGYGGIDDYRVTPFVRALDWTTLDDAWPSAIAPVGANQVRKYTSASPPLYTTPEEAGLSSPAVVDDVVFVTTTKPGLYGLDAETGFCLWAAPGLAGMPSLTYVLGPAVYGNYVVIGAGNSVKIYSLPFVRPIWPPIRLLPELWPPPPWWELIPKLPRPPFPPPPPPPPGARPEEASL